MTEICKARRMTLYKLRIQNATYFMAGYYIINVADIHYSFNIFLFLK